PAEPVHVHPLKFAGEPAEEKLKRLSGKLADDHIDHTVLTNAASLAWAFNIRGGDVAHTPLALGFTVLSAGGKPKLFLDSRKLQGEAETYLRELADLHAPEELEPMLASLAKGRRIGLDHGLAAERLRLLVEESGGTVTEFADPTTLP